MFEFQWQWVLWLLPLPLLTRWLIPAAGNTQAALKVPDLADFQMQQGGTQLKITSRPLNMLLLVLIWCSLLLASARPVWIGDSLDLPVSGRDLMLAVDLSGSMRNRDFVWKNRPVDRLTATKAVAGDFIQQRKGDRVGLILFGSNAYLQAPLTFDRGTVRDLLYESVIGLAGNETAIGDAIGLAVKRLRLKSNKAFYPVSENNVPDNNVAEKIDNNRVLILLTDGKSNAGEVEPLKAAQLAKQVGLKIYTIGIGTEGRRRSDLDENTLKQIANITGGEYFRARGLNELSRVYQSIDQLEPAQRDQMSFRPRKSLFMWPLAIALLFSGILSLRMLRQ